MGFQCLLQVCGRIIFAQDLDHVMLSDCLDARITFCRIFKQRVTNWLVLCLERWGIDISLLHKSGTLYSSKCAGKNPSSCPNVNFRIASNTFFNLSLGAIAFNHQQLFLYHCNLKTFHRRVVELS